MHRFALRALAFGVLGGVLNVATAHLARALGFPLLLETTGTVLVGAVAGFLPAVLAGVVTQSVFAVNGIVWVAFLPVHIVVAFYTARATRDGWFDGPLRGVAAGAVIGLAAAVVSWPIAFVLFGGILGGPLAPIREVLTGVGIPLRWAAYGARLTGEMLDKIVTVLVVVLLRGVFRTRPAG